MTKGQGEAPWRPREVNLPTPTIIASRVIAGQARARAKGVKFGRPPLAPNRVEKVRRALADGRSIRAVARATGVSTATVQRVKRTAQ